MRLVRSLVERRQERPDRGEHASFAAISRTAISRTVEDQVIPRLLEARLPDRPRLEAASQPALTGEADALAQLLLSGTQPETEGFVASLHKAGASRESVMLNLLTPAARRLGVMWAEDDCSFFDVTIGMIRLSKVLLLVSRAFEAEMPPVLAGPRALLVQAPGEQHGMGIAMVASFFRRAGWNVQSEPLPDREALACVVGRQWFSLVGLSVACTGNLDRLAEDIQAIRNASRNPAIGIMVGGAAFIEDPHRAQAVGADCTAADARLAVAQANALVSRLAHHP